MMRCGPFFDRYPDDKYDRFWNPQAGKGFVNITSASVLDSGLAVDKPPAAVMNTAVTTAATLVNQYIYYKFTPSTGNNNSFLINIYLAELQVQFLHIAPLSNGMFLFRRIALFFQLCYGVYKQVMHLICLFGDERVLHLPYG
jgi:hypothetical protein